MTNNHKLLIIFFAFWTFSCNNEKEINFNNFKPYVIDEDPNIDFQKNYYSLFLVCIKYNLPLSYYKSRTKLSDKRINEIIKYLEFSKYISVKENKINLRIFIADEKDKMQIKNLCDNTAKKLANLVLHDSIYIRNEFKKLKLSDTESYEKWSFMFIGNILIGQEQLYTITNNLLKDSSNRNGYKICYNSIIENDNPTLNNFYYNNYIDGTSASSYYEFGLYNKIPAKYYWQDHERENMVSIQDDWSLNFISFNYSKKIFPILKSDIDNVKKFYISSHFKDEISFNVFYFWYYHFLYSKAIDILIEQKFINLPEDNFKFCRLNECG